MGGNNGHEPISPRNAAYDWTALKLEYILGNYEEKSEFFRNAHPEIPEDTYSKQTTGWRDERRRHADKALEKALDKMATKRAKALEKMQLLGDAVSKVGLEALIDTNTGMAKLKPKSAGVAAYMVKTGQELVEKAYKLNEPVPQGGLSVGINIELKPEDIVAIRLLASQQARVQLLGDPAQRELLGEPGDPPGGRP